MNETNLDTNSKRSTLKSLLPQAIAGFLVGGAAGFVLGMEVAPLIGSIFVKPTPVILDPAGMLVGAIVIVVCTLGGAILGMYVSNRLAKG